MKSTLSRFSFVFLFFLLIALPELHAQDTLRVMAYNILRYGAQGIQCTPMGVTARNGIFTDILEWAKPDIFGVNEIGPIDNAVAPHVNVTQNILPNIGYGNYAATQINFDGNQDICNMMWYNTDKVGLSKQRFINVSGTLRDLDYYKFYYKGQGTIVDTTFLHVILVHYMSSPVSNQSVQAQAAMTYLNNNVGDGNIIIMGDMNLSGSGTQPYKDMINFTNQNVRMYDPLGSWGNQSYSQSTGGNSGCAVGNNLDDRFDLILTSFDLLSKGDGMDYVTGSYNVMGSPVSPNIPVSSLLQGSLKTMSDHYPVMLDLHVDKAVTGEKPLPQAALSIISPARGMIEGRVRIPGSLAGQYRLELRDLQGRIIAKQTETWASGQHNFQMEATFAPGVYLFRMEQDGQPALTRKLVLMD